MLSIDELKFDERGLIPAIVVDHETRRVLTLAYMNRESLSISMEKGLTCFWSRSRSELWLKGETSGNYQHIQRIIADCDRDALTVEVIKDGPACHLGTDSCFNDLVWINPEAEAGGRTAACKVDDREDAACAEAVPTADTAMTTGNEACADEAAPAPFALDDLMDLLLDRRAHGKEGSYTTYLFEKGRDKILKKIGEESTEVIIAAKADDRAETIYEIADLTYHVMVLMAEMGLSLDEIRQELASRHVIDHKVKQEKMTGEKATGEASKSKK